MATHTRTSVDGSREITRGGRNAGDGLRDMHTSPMAVHNGRTQVLPRMLSMRHKNPNWAIPKTRFRSERDVVRPIVPF